MSKIYKILRVLPLVLALVGLSLSGCQREEEVLDVETPNGEMEVNENQETGELDVEVDEE